MTDVVTNTIWNAKIKDTLLGFMEIGPFTFSLTFDYNSGEQQWGDISLGDEKGFRLLARIMEVVGVQQWEDLKYKYVRLLIDGSRIMKVGNLIKEEWIDLKDWVCRR